MLKTVLRSVPGVSRFWKRSSSFCPPPDMDPFTQVTMLHNGMKIATEEVYSPLACVSLVVAAGSRYETVCTNGLTHFIEHVAFKGFKTMDKCKLEEAVIDMSAKMTVETRRDMQIFSVVLPSENTTLAIEKLYKIICDLDLNDSEMERERYNICLELADSDINPKEVVFDYLHQAAFQGTPLAQRVMGTSENLARFDSNMTANFLCEHYQPYRLILATSGGVNHDKITQFAEVRFGCLAPQPCCEPEPGPCRFSGSQVVFRDDSLPFCHVAIAFEAPGYASDSYLTMLMMKNIVGSWDRSQGLGDGNASMAARELAKSGTCERYQSFYIAYKDVGLWGVYFVGDKWRLDEAVSYIQDHWMHLCTMPLSTDVERGVNCTKVELCKPFTSVVRSSRDIGKQMMYTSMRRSLDSWYASLSNIKARNVQELADKYLYDKCPVVASMGPSETLPDYVRIKSSSWWLRV